MNDNDTIKLNIDTGNSITNLTNIYERLNQLNVSFQNLSNKNVNLKVNINENINESKEKIKNFFNIIKNFEEEKKIPKIISEKFIQQLQSIERDTNRYVDNINKALKKINEGNLSKKQLAFQKGNITLNTNKVNQLYSEDNLKKIEISVLNIKNIVDQNIKLSKQQDEFNKRQSIQEQESLKTIKETVQYQRELNELQKAELQNNKLKNDLNISQKQIAKISKIDIDKQTNLGLAKLNVSNIEALSREQNNDIKLRLKLQNDLNKALNDQLNIEQNIIKEEKYINKQYNKEQAIYVKEDEKIRKKEEAIYRQYLKEEDRKKKVEIGKDVGYNKYIQKEEDRRYAEEEAIYRQYLKEEDRKTKELNKKIKERKKLLAKSSKNALSLKEIDIDTPILQEQLHNLIKSAPQSMQALISTSSPLYQSPLKFSSQNITNKFEKFSKEELKAEQVKASSNYIRMSSTEKLNIEQQIQNALKEKIKIIEKELALNNKIEKKYENIVKEINKATKEQEKENENINKLLLLEKEINVLLENRSQHPKYYSGAKQDKADNYIQEIQKLQQQSNVNSPQEQLKIGEKLLNLLKQENNLIKDEAKEQEKYNDLLKNTKSITEEILNKEKTYKGKIKENKIVQEIQEKVFTPIRTDYKKINLDIKNQKQLIEGSSFNLLTREEQLKELETYKTLLKEKLKITKNIEDQVDIIIKNHSKERIKIEKQAEEEKIKQLKIFEEEKEKIRKKGLTFQLTSGVNAQEYKKGGVGEGGWKGSGWVITGENNEKKNIISVGNIDFGSMGNKRQTSYINRQENLLPSNKKDEEWFKQADQVEKNINKTKQARAEIQKQFDIISGYSHQSFQSITTDINLAGNALSLFGQQLANVGMQAISEAGEWEVLRNKLATFTGSAKEAHERFEDLVQLGLKTPFEIKGLLQAEILLRSFGNETKDLLPKVVNLASAMGKDVDKAAYAVARAMSGASLGFLMLQKTWGVSYGKLKELGAEFKNNGQIVASSVKTQNALKMALDELNGSADRLSKTYKGQMSNLSDAVSVLREQLGRQLLPMATTIVKEIRAFLNILNMLPDSVKSSATALTTLFGATGLVLGSLGNLTWQLGNLAQLPQALKQLPNAFKDLMNITNLSGAIGDTAKKGLVAKEAFKGMAQGQKLINNETTKAIPIITALGTAFSSWLGIVGIVTVAIGGLILILREYKKRQEELKQEELILAELHRNQTLDQLSITLGKVNNGHEIYNKLINKNIIDLMLLTDKEVLFSNSLKIQHQDLDKLKDKAEETRKKLEEAKKAKENYEKERNGEKIKPDIKSDYSYDYGHTLTSAGRIKRENYETTKENKKAIELYKASEEKKVLVKQVIQNRIDNTQELLDKQIKERNKLGNEKIVSNFKNDEKPSEEIQKKINLLDKEIESNQKLLEQLNSETILEEKLKIIQDKKIELLTQEDKINAKNLANLEMEIVNTIYLQKETNRLLDTYGRIGDVIKEIQGMQTLKKGLRPEIMDNLIETTQDQLNKVNNSITPEDTSKYNKFKTSDKSAIFKGRAIGELPNITSSEFRKEYENKLGKKFASQEDFEKYINDDANKEDAQAKYSQYKKDVMPKINKEVENAALKAGFKDTKEFEATRGKFDQKEILSKNLNVLKNVTPNDDWHIYRQLQKDLLTKPGSKEEIIKAAKAVQEAWDTAWQSTWDDFNTPMQEAMARGEVSQAEYLQSFEQFLIANNDKLEDNQAKKAQLWNQYRSEYAKFLKEKAKADADLERGIAAGTPGKLDDIEAERKASIISLNQEFETRSQLEGRTSKLHAWYMAQRKAIDRKAHEDTIRQLNEEYEQRVAIYARAEVAHEKLGTIDEKRANEKAKWMNDQAKADSEYKATKERLIQEQKFDELAKLEIAYLGESQKRNQEYTENLRRLALEELQIRTDLKNTVAEHKRKTGEFTDQESLLVQKKSAEAMIKYLKDEAMQYEKIAENGSELTDIQKNILTNYQSQEEKLKEINATLDYRLNKEGEIFQKSYDQFKEKIGLYVSEKSMTEEVAKAREGIFLQEQIEFEKNKMALLEEKELHGDITDAERAILSEMRQRKNEYSNIVNSMSDIYSKVRAAVEETIRLRYATGASADNVMRMSDKFKSAVEQAKQLLEQVTTIGNITSGINTYGTMGNFSSLEGMIKDVGGGATEEEKLRKAEWIAELRYKQGKDEKKKTAREILDEGKASAQKEGLIQKDINTEMKGYKSEIDAINEMTMQEMTASVMGDVYINGEKLGESSNGTGGGGGVASEGEGGDSGEGKNVGNTYSGQKTEISTGQQTTDNITAEGSSTIKSNTEVKPGLDYNTKSVSEQQALQESLKLASYQGRKDWNREGKNPDQLKSSSSTITRKTGAEELADTIGITGVDDPAERARIAQRIFEDSHDNPINDANANKSGKWAIKTINKSIYDYTSHFLKGMVSQNKENLRTMSNNYVNNNQNNSQNNSRIENKYTINVDGRQTNITNPVERKTTRDFVSMQLARVAAKSA